MVDSLLFLRSHVVSTKRYARITTSSPECLTCSKGRPTHAAVDRLEYIGQSGVPAFRLNPKLQPLEVYTFRWAAVQCSQSSQQAKGRGAQAARHHPSTYNISRLFNHFLNTSRLFNSCLYSTRVLHTSFCRSKTGWDSTTDAGGRGLGVYRCLPLGGGGG